jgi:tetratricopeptide (TPR) repeat protein
MTAAVLAMQRCWILAHRGDGVPALAAIDGADPSALSPAWRAEAHYSRAAALLALDRVAAARAEVEAGIAVARRTSSQRNGWFLLARVAEREGAVDRAYELFERGACHAYRRQGGESLLAWGDVLLRQGRHTEAHTAWALVVERDPESEAARIAQARTAHDSAH